MVASLLNSTPANGFGSAQPAGARMTTDRVGQSIAYMMRNLDKPLQVSALAALANTSTSHFFALFKRLTGQSPIDYFIRLRMQRACELLQDPSLRIKEVAACLGYDDPFYFSRLFKSVHSLAPTQYRLLQSDQRSRTQSRSTFRNFKLHQDVAVGTPEPQRLGTRPESCATTDFPAPLGRGPGMSTATRMARDSQRMT